jgi:hypothetical protein
MEFQDYGSFSCIRDLLVFGILGNHARDEGERIEDREGGISCVNNRY